MDPNPATNGAGGTAVGEQLWQRNAPVVPAPARRRSRGLIGLGIAVIAACGVGAVAFYDSTSDLVPAVGVMARVPFGSVVGENDLVQIQVHPDPAVTAVPWAQRGQVVVGQRAATDLLPGSVITAGAVGGVSIPGPGQALVGVAVKPGQLPATPLAARDTVLLVATDGPVGDAAGPPGPAVHGTVVTVGEPDGAGARTVDVEVASGDAGGLAARAAAGRIAVVLEPKG